MIPENFKMSKAIIYAPLAGISDSLARKIARNHGADMTISELISSEGIIRGGEKTLEIARFNQSERPLGLQIFGSKPESMAESATILASLSPDFIDINFGCPARKVVGKNGGSSVLKDLSLLKRIVAMVVKAVDIPVTVKMRSGWDSGSLTYLEAGKIIEDCGAAAVTLHPRTKVQSFTGRADWSQIAELKQSLKIPVIGNGDISSPEDAGRMFSETGCDAIMVGRAAIGNPWIFNRIKEYLNTGEVPPEPTPRQRMTLALEHFDSMIDKFGVPRGVFKMRAVFCWYFRGLPGISEIRFRINRMISPEEIKVTISSYLETLELNSEISGQEAVSSG